MIIATEEAAACQDTDEHVQCNDIISRQAQSIKGEDHLNFKRDSISLKIVNDALSNQVIQYHMWF